MFPAITDRSGSRTLFLETGSNLRLERRNYTKHCYLGLETTAEKILPYARVNASRCEPSFTPSLKVKPYIPLIQTRRSQTHICHPRKLSSSTPSPPPRKKNRSKTQRRSLYGPRGSNVRRKGPLSRERRAMRGSPLAPCATGIRQSTGCFACRPS